MTTKKFEKIRWTTMIFGTLLNASLIINFLISLYNLENQEVRKIVVPIFVSFIFIKMIFFLLCGRLFCGFLCPVGLIQDLINKFSEKICLPRIDRDTKLMKIINIFNKIFFAFFLFAITTLSIFIIFFPSILAKVNFPFILPVAGLGIMSVILSFLGRRFFCNLCPYGSFVGLFERLNIFKIKKNNNKCSNCGACYQACPMRIKSLYLENTKTDVFTSSCILCGECIKKCPKDDALYMTFKGKTIYKSSLEDFLQYQFPNKNKDINK